MDQRSPRPFSTGVPVRASRLWAGMRRSAWAVSLAEFLMAWASSMIDPVPVDAGQALDVAKGGGVGGEHHVVVGGLAVQLGEAGPVRAVVQVHLQAPG